MVIKYHHHPCLLSVPLIFFLTILCAQNQMIDYSSSSDSDTIIPESSLSSQSQGEQSRVGLTLATFVCQAMLSGTRQNGMCMGHFRDLK